MVAVLVLVQLVQEGVQLEGPLVVQGEVVVQGVVAGEDAGEEGDVAVEGVAVVVAAGAAAVKPLFSSIPTHCLTGLYDLAHKCNFIPSSYEKVPLLYEYHSFRTFRRW